MKQFWISIGMLVVVTAGVFWHCHFVHTLTGEMSSLLARAERAADAEAWPAAERLVQEAQSLWEGNRIYLYITLRHSDIDQIHVGLAEACGYLRHRDGNGYAAVSIRLRDAVRKLDEMERPTLLNLL